MPVRNKAVPAPAVQTVSAPVPAAVSPVAAAIVGAVVPMGEIRCYEIGRTLANHADFVGRALREVADYLIGKKYADYKNVRKWIIGGFVSVGGKTEEAAEQVWTRDFVPGLKVLKVIPESEKSSAKREPSEAAQAIAKLSDADLQAQLKTAMDASDMSEIAKLSGAADKRAKDKAKTEKKAQTEARTKAWKPLKETLDTFETTELLLVRDFSRLILETRGDAKRRAAIKKAISK